MYLFPPFVEKRKHVAKQEEAPSLFANMNVFHVYARYFFNLKKTCGTVPSAAGFLLITATLQAPSH